MAFIVLNLITFSEDNKKSKFNVKSSYKMKYNEI